MVIVVVVVVAGVVAWVFIEASPSKVATKDHEKGEEDSQAEDGDF